jgi:hypothetical protein
MAPDWHSAVCAEWDPHTDIWPVEGFDPAYATAESGDRDAGT